jgi:signal transduction histidine kinase
MLKVLNGLLELSRNEAGMAAVERAPLRLRELLEDVAALYRAAAESKRVALSLSVAPDVPELLHSDATRLREVLDNLCHNAVKFTARGEVRLAAAREGENLLLTVADTGPGIEREDLSRIFMPFARGGNARGQEGCGLGLSLVKGAIESLGGGVRVASTPGVGSTFTVWHPLAVDEASPEA